MQAIQTRYLGPTDHRGSRIVAQCQAKRITVAYDHSLSLDGNHRAAARALVLVMHWHRNHLPGGEPREVLYSGTLPDGTFAHVFADPLAVIDATGEPAREYKSIHR